MGKLAWEGVGRGCKFDPRKGEREECEEASQTAVPSQGDPERPPGSYGTSQWQRRPQALLVTDRSSPREAWLLHKHSEDI